MQLFQQMCRPFHLYINAQELKNGAFTNSMTIQHSFMFSLTSRIWKDFDWSIPRRLDTTKVSYLDVPIRSKQ